MKRLALALLSLLLASAAQAQSTGWPPPAGTVAFLCVYNLVAPTMTSGTAGYAQCDINGKLITSGGGGGGGAVTIADGADVAEGAKADVAWVSGSGSMIAIAKTIAGNTGGPIPVPTTTVGALTGVSCGSAVSSCVLKASTGNFFGVYAECTSACWLMIFNSTSAPSNGATTAGVASGNLVECIDISAASSKSITYPTFPRNYTVGITVAISSTACASLTLSTVGFVSGSVM